jgi:phage shock protein C
MSSMNQSPRTRTGGPYRSRDGFIFGVCRGLAEHLGFSLVAMRIIVVVGTLFTGIWPGIVTYIIAALLMKPEPIVPFDSQSDAEFYNSYSASSTMALQRLKDTFDNLDRRIQRMENIVTAPDYDWDERLKNNQ